MPKMFPPLIVALLLALSPLTAARNNSLPVVDLGYERHRANSWNQTGDYYNFTNIRFGQAPVGELRWASPIAPVREHNSSIVPIVDGSEQGGNCPQTSPCWFGVQNAFAQAYLAGNAFDFDSTSERVYGGGQCSEPTPASARDPHETEDCLFLDVFAPRTIFNSANSSSKAPVLVYIYGGGWASGAKDSFGHFHGSPAGLLDSSRVTSPDGIIYVAFNYRLGSLGWMFGSEFISQGGQVNAGLYDQRLALQWIQQNIHLFGGDPNRVTVMGVSAGGGSIIQQMTAFGNSKNQSTPFQQAITQSPSMVPSHSPSVQNQRFAQLLDLLNVSSLDAARKLPSQQVIDANHIMLSSTPYGSILLSPVVDGEFIPDDPRRLLRDGRVDERVKVLTTIGSNEAVPFAPANITSEADFRQYVDVFLEAADIDVRDHVADTVYPPVFDGSLGYTDQLGRARLFWSELVSTCNTPFLHEAVTQPGYSNLFDVWPAMHQGDVPYVFFNGPETISAVNGTVARVIQDYITAFVANGDPNNAESPALSEWDPSSMLAMSDRGFQLAADPTANDRCAYWHDAPFQS